MANKRFLYLTARRLQAYTWKAGKLIADGAFESDESGVEAFAHYLGSSARALYYVVPDVSEEDFFQENIPYVSGKDRRTLLGRKIAQRYRDTSLALALSLGTEQGARREDRMLFSSFTNTQQFHPWLAVLRTNESRLVGVYSTALLAPVVAKRLKLTATRRIFVTFQGAGMRQTYLENGKIRFSRLGRADAADPRAAAEACAAEANRIFQYLINLRILPRETASLDVTVLAPSAHWTEYRKAWGNNARLKLDLIDVDAACKQLGLKSAPPDMLAERLFMHVLAGTQPSEQFASDSLRRFYRLWWARMALIGGGAAICAILMLVSGLRYIDVYGTTGRTTAERRQAAVIIGEYDKLQARFPKTPVPREALTAAVESADAIVRQTAFPDRFFADISQALSALPQIELDKIEWDISDDPRSRVSVAPSGSKSAKTPAPAKTGAATGPERAYFEVAVLSAHIKTVKASDYRSTRTIVEQFVQALKRRPGLEVIDTRTPYDTITEKAVAGDAGSRESDEMPQFTITISRRINA